MKTTLGVLLLMGNIFIFSYFLYELGVDFGEYYSEDYFLLFSIAISSGFPSIYIYKVLNHHNEDPLSKLEVENLIMELKIRNKELIKEIEAEEHSN